MSRFAICFGLIGACIAAAPAQATVTITPSPVAIGETQLGFSFTRRYFGYINDVKQDGLQADVVFTLTSVSNLGRRWAFTAQITNNTSAAFSSSLIGMFGFSTDNNVLPGTVLPISSVTTPFATAFGNRNVNNLTGFTVPDLSPNVQVCLKTGGTAGECDTMNTSGVAKGASLSQAFTLNFVAAPGMVTLQNFVLRFRDVTGNAVDSNNGSFPVSGIYASAAGEVVPEPSSWAMMIAGFGLVGALRRRQQRQLA